MLKLFCEITVSTLWILATVQLAEVINTQVRIIIGSFHTFDENAKYDFWRLNLLFQLQIETEDFKF